MRTAPAQVLGERGADLFFSRIARRLQERGRLHDHAVDTVAALHRLLGDERPLERMRPARGAKPLERDDLPACDRRNRHRAGANRLAVDMHRARAALAQAAAEARPVQTQIVAQCIEQRHLRIVGGDRRRLAVQIERDQFHRGPSFLGKRCLIVNPPAARVDTRARTPRCPIETSDPLTSE